MRRARPKRKAPRALWLAGAPLAPGGVSAAVFELPGAGGGRSWPAAAAVSLAAALGAVAWVGAAPARRTAAVTKAPEMTVELFELPPPPPPPAAPPPAAAAPPPPAAAAPVRAQPRVVREPAATPPAPTPAQAAEVVAQESPSDQPVDLTSFTIATGSGQRYAGGKTSSGGTSTQAVTGAASADGVPNGTGTGTADLSRPVRLADSEWECPWPAEADSLGIDEQAVLMRVVVRANGSVESAELVSDPGNGFGQAALACARRSRFEPALDRGGAALRARSGPIRVLFTR